MIIEDNELYAVRFGTGYIYLHEDGSCRGSKKKGSIVSGRKLKRLPFDINKALESGMICLEKVV